jgi:pilus assembly protein CpaF
VELTVGDLAGRVARRHPDASADGRLGGAVADLVDELAPAIEADDRRQLIEATLAEIGGLGPLQPLLARPDVTDVMVNGPGRVFIDRGDRIEETGVELDGAAIRRLIDRVIAPLGLRIDRSSPAVDARLPDGSRLHAVLPPVGVDGPYVTIRRHAVRSVPLGAMASPECAERLRAAVADRRTILVCGPTGAGKTTLLNTLGSLIPAGERVITIEDAAELALGRRHVVRLESRPAGADGIGAVTLRDLVRHSLRMRPDRFVIGEVRGPEAFDMIGALMTGHRGSMATLHAWSASDALLRLETLAMTAGSGITAEVLRRQIASAIDVVVTVERVGAARRVRDVTEVRSESEGAHR